MTIKYLLALLLLLAVSSRSDAVGFVHPGGSGSGGSATNVILRGAVPGLVTTNGTGDWTLTGNASTATNSQFSQMMTWRATNDFISEFRVAERLPLPPRIWGSWNDYGSFIPMDYITNVSETNILLQAHWMKTNGMWDAGWRWIVIEEGWNAGLDSNGDFIITNRFPNGMKFVADQLREMGFKPGIYTGINADSPALTCMGYGGTCYTNLGRHMQTFADWGMEFLFFDSCQGYYQWTQAPAGTPVAAFGDERALFLERARLINEAIERAKFKYPPAVLLSPPFAVTGTNLNGTLFPDQQAAHQVNIWPIHPTNNYDFVGVGFGNIAQYFLTNAPLAARITGKGHYQYGYIQSTQIDAKDIRMVNAWNAVLPAMMNFASGANRINFWVNPTTYNPTTWNIFTANDPRTNLLVAAIHQDPACIPGQVVYSNSSAYAVVRPFGGYNSGTNSILLVNYGASSATFQLQHKWLGVRDTLPLTYSDVDFGTNVATLVTSNTPITLTSSNVLFLLSYPSTPNSYRELVVSGTFRAECLTGSTASEITATGYAPSDRWFARDGIQQSAGNNQFNYYIPIPKWASSVEFSCDMTCEATGTVAWTNQPGYEYYSQSAATRVTYDYTTDPNITNSHINTTRTTLTTYKTGFPVVVTNSPRLFNFGVLAGSNTAARYVVGPYRIKFVGTESGSFP